MTSDGGAANIVSIVDGHVMKTASKAPGSAPSREVKDEAQQENQFPLVPPLLFHSGKDLQAKLWHAQ